ncbi:MAG: amidohydrolase family protein [Clostridiales bacterium]|nr:amidohydrolase family protein [Clostridiales bacterium]
MGDLEFFDCNCSFGMRSILYPESFYKVEDLVKKMDRYGIKRALVYHSMAREYAPSVGNRMLMDEIKVYPFLIPLWTVMPHHTQEFPEPYRLIEQMKAYGVKAVTMFPGAMDHAYSMAEWNCGQLFEALEEHGIPLILGFDQTTWNELYDLLSNHPKLNLILTNVNYRMDRNIYVLFRMFENLFIETRGYQVYQGIEQICNRFGACRLIFGSGMPVYSGSAAVAMINYARISDKEKEMIAYRNLETLIGEVKL